MKAWLAALLFTQLVEVPIYTAALRGRPHVAFAASLLTHPVVWFGFPLLGRVMRWSLPGTVLAAEALAVLIEGIFLGAMGMKRPFAWALLANSASATLGLLSWTLSGSP